MDRSEGLMSRQPIKHRNLTHPRVMRISYNDQSDIILKICKTPDTSKCEAAVLEILSAKGAHVPKLIDHDPRGVLIMQYIDGSVLGCLSPCEIEGSIPELMRTWRNLCNVWKEVEEALSHLNTPSPKENFVKGMKGIGNWLCEKAPYPEHAERAWKDILEIAVSAPQRLGSLDYNPYNLIKTEEGYVFIDFETIGLDWNERRLWQYTTLIRDANDKPCWYPLLREKLSTDPVAEAHYILFATMAIKRFKNPVNRYLTLLGEHTTEHLATVMWKDAWNIDN